jgi:hypothetical protein
VTNSCLGATTGANDLFSGTAAALVRGGISAVTAMQYEISDAAAIAFARGFYTAIARGRGVDQAVKAGRVAILGTSQDTLEWVTPVLYLRGDQTHLYTIPPPAPDHAQVGHQHQQSSPIVQKDDRVEIIWDPLTRTRRFLVPPAIAWEWIKDLEQEESSNDEG